MKRLGLSSSFFFAGLLTIWAALWAGSHLPARPGISAQKIIGKLLTLILMTALLYLASYVLGN